MTTNLISQSNSTQQEPAQASNESWDKAVAVKSQDALSYGVGQETAPSSVLSESDLVTLSEAAAIYERVLMSRGVSLGNPRDSADFIKARLFGYQYEIFGCLFLDNRHCVIQFSELFRGTVDGASVHPREVVKEALKVNACAVIFAHNHPSGKPEPSAADRAITNQLRETLQLVGVRVLDHLIVGDGEPVSMAARGLI